MLTMVNDLLNERIMYGGMVATRGEAYEDALKITGERGAAEMCAFNTPAISETEQNKPAQPKSDNGNGKKKRKHYANARRPVPDEALHELRQHPWNEHRLACELLYALGIRAEELLDLRREDFEKRPGYVWVNRRKGGEQPWLPLLDKLMHPELLGFLTKWLEKMPDAPDSKVFTLRYPAFYQWCRRNLKVAPHMFRHGIAERLDEASCNPRQIQSWLGHKSLQTTMGYLSPSIEGIARKLNGNDNGNGMKGE